MTLPATSYKQQHLSTAQASHKPSHWLLCSDNSVKGHSSSWPIMIFKPALRDMSWHDHVRHINGSSLLAVSNLFYLIFSVSFSTHTHYWFQNLHKRQKDDFSFRRHLPLEPFLYEWRKKGVVRRESSLKQCMDFKFPDTCRVCGLNILGLPLSFSSWIWALSMIL